MELDFLPSIGKAIGKAADFAKSSYDALVGFIERNQIKEEKSFKIELGEEGSRILRERAAQVPEPRLETPQGMAQLAKSFLLEAPARAAAQTTLKLTGQGEFNPGTGVAPSIETFLFGYEPIKKPEGALETSIAILGTIPFFGGKAKAGKEIADQLIAKYGSQVANRILKEGTKDLAEKAVIKGGEDLVAQFFATQTKNTPLIQRVTQFLTKDINTLFQKAEKAKEAAEKPSAAGKLTEIVKGSATKARAETERLFTAERGRRFTAAETILQAEKAGGTRQAFQKSKMALGGELPRAQFESIENKLSQTDIEELFSAIDNYPGLWYTERLNLAESLEKLFLGTIPGEKELINLEKIFGSKLVEAIRNLRPGSEKFMEILGEVLNIPRAVVSSFDMSAPLRQGLVFTLTKPHQAIPAFTNMVRVFGSEKMFQATMLDITSRPSFKLMQESGLFLAEITSKAVGLVKREEAFLSSYAERIPIIGRVVRASERAYVGFLNKLRADVFDDISKQFILGDITPESNPLVFQKLAEFINTMTGRGNLYALNPAAPVLNGIFFSPRFMAARVQALNPAWYMSLPAPVRKEAMKSMVQFIATGLGIIALAKLGGAEVEDSALSSDFGKIRYGNTRWDVWGGFQQWVRFGTQMITGKTKSTTGVVRDLSGKEFPFTDRWDLLTNFFRGKFAPVPALMADLITGSNVIGQETKMDISLMQKVMPLYLQDMADAVQEMGATGAIQVGVPAFFGVGTQVFTPDELRKSSSKSNPSRLPSLPAMPKLPTLPALSK